MDPNRNIVIEATAYFIPNSTSRYARTRSRISELTFE